MANTFGGFAENPDGGRGPLAPAERQVQIEETLQMMMNTMRRMETSIQEELTNINVKIDNLSRQAAVNSLNQSIRDANIVAINKAGIRPASLGRMYSVHTGRIIEGFPYTLTSLCTLTNDQVDSILRELGLPVTGRWPGGRREMLWTYVGAGKAP